MNLIPRALTLLALILPGILLGDYWQQKVIYDIDVTLIDTLNQVNGHESITYINNSPDDLDYIWMHLWPNAYKNNKSALGRQYFSKFNTKMHFSPDSSFGWIDIENVVSQGKELKWEYRSADTIDVAIFYLNETLKSGDTLQFDMDLTIQVPNVISRMGHFGHHYEMTQWYPKPAVYDTKGWHPMSYLDKGEFYSEWGDFEVSITLPENYRVAATGVLQDSSEIVWRDSLAMLGNAYLDTLSKNKKAEVAGLDTLIDLKPISSDSFKTITFKQENVHDFAWFADKRFVIISDTTVLPSGKTIQNWTYSLPANFMDYKLSNTYIDNTLRHYSKWFMDYPYEHATVVDGDFSAGGGMEYPMITLINNISFQPVMELVIMHEVGHNWFYGLSGSNERDYPWMDEGFNTYAENRYWKTKYPDDNFLSHHGDKPGWLSMAELFVKDLTKKATEDLAFYLSAGPRLDQPADLHSEAYSSFNYGMMAYKKAALATASLHAYLGESMMDSVWHEYFKQWAYKHPQPEDVRQLFESVSSEDLSWYFDDMLGSTKRIDYAIDDFTNEKRGDSFETTIRIQNLGDYSPPLPVGLVDKQGNQTINWIKPVGEHDVFQMKTEYPVQDVILDPNQVLMDMNRTNNSKHLNLDFDLAKFALNPKGDYVITSLPYLWWNSIDQVFPGLILMHKNFMPWGDTNWYLRTFYGPRTKKLGVAAKADKKFFPKSGKEIKLSTRLNESWYYRLAEFRTDLKIRNLKFSDDSHNWKFSILAQDLFDGELAVDGEPIIYLDHNMWDIGKVLKTSLDYKTTTRRTLWKRKFGVSGLLGFQEAGKPFAKVKSYFQYQKRYSRKGSIWTSFFAAYGAGDLPTQERFYLSTDISPAFDNILIFGRNDSWYTPGHYFYYQDEFTVPGYTYSEADSTLPSTSGLLGAKLQASIPKMEKFSLLLAGGLALDHNDADIIPIGSVSAVLDGGMIQIIYTPVIIEDSGVTTDWKQFQIGIRASTIRIGI